MDLARWGLNLPELMPHFYGQVRGDQVEITGEDARHLALALRARPGEVILVLDPPASRLEVRLTEVSRERVRGRVEKRTPHHPEPAARVTMAISMLPAAQLDLCLSRCTELGAHAFVLVAADRAVAKGGNPRRWEAICREAAMLAGRFQVPQVSGPVPLASLAGAILLDREAPRRLATLAVSWPLVLAVGPEGGWSERERSWAKDSIASLGPRNLRAENAGATALAVALSALGEI